MFIFRVCFHDLIYSNVLYVTLCEHGMFVSVHVVCTCGVDVGLEPWAVSLISADKVILLQTYNYSISIMYYLLDNIHRLYKNLLKKYFYIKPVSISKAEVSQLYTRVILHQLPNTHIINGFSNCGNFLSSFIHWIY